MNWQDLSAGSPYRTAIAIKDEIDQGHIEEARAGIKALIEALSRSERRALKSQLVRLMLHIIEWHTQPERRSLSWIASIEDARDEITDIQEETPSLNDEAIETLWKKAFAMAKRDAQAEMGRLTEIEGLSWKAVFEEDYELDAR